ncbi:MAG: anti-sigma factor [Candidatus Omnitrophica bacterium]|nr:anti-sigma factor [Candidatus Omnitrophota bacterium]
MNECAKIKRLLSLYIDQEANNADTALVEAHLDKCPGCQKELSQLSRIKGCISEKERRVLPPDYLISRLRDEITSRQYARDRLSLVRMGNFARRLIPVPVAAIVLMTMLMFMSVKQTVDTDSLEDNILNGVSVTEETILGLVLGTQG